MIALVLLVVGSPAGAQELDTPDGPASSPLEVTEDGELIYGGDVSYECESVGSGIVGPAPNSDAATRAELERTNERAIELCTEAGFPPAGARVDALPDTGGVSLAAFAAVGAATGFVLIRRTAR